MNIKGFAYKGAQVMADLYVDVDQSLVPLCKLVEDVRYSPINNNNNYPLTPKNRASTFDTLADLLSDIIVKIAFSNDPSNDLDNKISIKAYILSLSRLQYQEDIWRIVGEVVGFLINR